MAEVAKFGKSREKGFLGEIKLPDMGAKSKYIRYHQGTYQTLFAQTALHRSFTGSFGSKLHMRQGLNRNQFSGIMLPFLNLMMSET